MDVFAGITFDSLTSDTSTTSYVSKTGTSTATAYSSSSTSSSKTGSYIGFYSDSDKSYLGGLSVNKTGYQTSVSCRDATHTNSNLYQDNITEEECNNLVFDCDSISYGDSYSFCSAGQYLVGCKTDSNGNNVVPISSSSSDNTALKNCLLYGGECDTCPSPGTSASATTLYVNAGSCCRVVQNNGVNEYKKCQFTFTKTTVTKAAGESTPSIKTTVATDKLHTIITLDKCYSTTGSDATGYFEWVDTNLNDKQCYYDTTN